MPLPLPASLSPSKVASFKDCAMAFRFSAIDRVPEPPTVWAAKGTLVHRALELMYLEEPHLRTVELALDKLEIATPEILGNHEYDALTFTDEEREAFLGDAARMVRNTFRMEDPTKVRPIGLELRMEAHLGSLKLRGIIDRLELDENGELVVTDYKTGKVPGERQEQSRLGGVQFYAFLCEQMLGRRPAKVQLMYLSQPLMIVTEPSEQSLRGLTMRTSAIWTAVERACARDDFRPKPSRLCDYCSYKAYCPAFGGDPALAPTRRLTHLPDDAAIFETAGVSPQQITERVSETITARLDEAAGPAIDRVALSGGLLDLRDATEDALLDSVPSS
jgi:putative RecB family exonuclease